MDLIDAIRNYEQADSEGELVLVSRQACDECAAEIERLRAALQNLAAMVRGECPSLLDEDSGGCAGLGMEIDALLPTNP